MNQVIAGIQIRFDILYSFLSGELRDINSAINPVINICTPTMIKSIPKKNNGRS